MLRIDVLDTEVFDAKDSTFRIIKGCRLQLEHSLVSLSKWESKWHKSFMNSEKSIEENLDYIRCMTITQNVPDEIYTILSDKNLAAIKEYINDRMTATYIHQSQQKTATEVITAELIYYWMILFQIPSEYEKWHLNRLLTLINVCNIKQSKKKNTRFTSADFAARRNLNAARLEQQGIKS